MSTLTAVVQRLDVDATKFANSAHANDLAIDLAHCHLHPHALTLRANPYASLGLGSGARCDKCRVSIKTSYNCRESGCNFDLCMKCYDENAPRAIWDGLGAYRFSCPASGCSISSQCKLCQLMQVTLSKPHAHALTVKTGVLQQCNICGRLDNTAYVCGNNNSCLYEECSMCFKVSYSVASKAEHSAHSHALVLATKDRPTHRCNGSSGKCRNSMKVMFRCASCDYDECVHCVRIGSFASRVTPSSFGPHGATIRSVTGRNDPAYSENYNLFAMSDTQRTELKAKLKKLEDDYAATKVKLQEEKKLTMELNDKLAKMTKTQADLYSRLSTAMSSTTTDEAKIAAIQSELESAKSEKDTIARGLAIAMQEKLSLQQQVTSLEQKYATEKANYEKQLKAKDTAHQEAIAKVIQESRSREEAARLADMKRLERERDDAKKLAQVESSAANAATADIAAERKKNKEAQETIMKLTRAQDQLFTQIEELRKQLSEEQKKSSDGKNELEALRTQFTTLTMAMASLQTEKTEAVKKLEDLTKASKEERERYEALIVETEKKHKAAAAKELADKLAKEQAEKNEELKKLKEERDAAQKLADELEAKEKEEKERARLEEEAKAEEAKRIAEEEAKQRTPTQIMARYAVTLSSAYNNNEFPRQQFWLKASKFDLLNAEYRVYFGCDGLWALPRVGAKPEHYLLKTTRQEYGLTIRIPKNKENSFAVLQLAALRLLVSAMRTANGDNKVDLSLLVCDQLRYKILENIDYSFMREGKYFEGIEDKYKELASKCSVAVSATTVHSRSDLIAPKIAELKQYADASKDIFSDDRGGVWDGVQNTCSLQKLKFKDENIIVWMCNERAKNALEFYSAHFEKA